MDSDAIEVRAIARVSAVLIAMIGGTLLSTVRTPPAPSPGVAQSASVQVIRKKDVTPMAMAAADLMAGPATPSSFAADDGHGLGEEIRLWVNTPAGEIVFNNAERYQRCLRARQSRMETADCPSAEDSRRMVLDATAAGPRDV
ncbi:MAG: hypothetical protein NW200_07665 [Hyphomonadaceae bacterium]|nr:hypothetical protein [Hyphomonadaceae bacterium]